MLLIFDCDGVLVDSEPLACRIDAEALTALGFPFTPEEIMRRFVGASLKDMVARIEAEHGRPLPSDFGARLTCSLLARFETELKPIAGVREAVLALPHRRCVASSSAPDRIALSLRVTGLADLFGHAFSAVDVKRGKPAPDLFLHAAERMGTAPRDCLVIEDSVFGIEAARSAGMRVIGFVGGGHCGPGHGGQLAAAGADLVVERMQSLPEAVAALAPVAAAGGSSAALVAPASP
ncbi:MAG TPA: HAD family phosphatase [Microvirga sp.]|nr:HAD family phosphatase [Microvirga sp.]